MSGTATKNLSRENIHQLLISVGSKPAEDKAQIEATEYNWREPHYFSSEQLIKLDDFAKTVAAAVAEKLADFFRSEFDVKIASTTQHFADEFLSQLSGVEQKDYYFPFNTDLNSLFGLIGIPEQTAVVWATQLLGDSESEGDSIRILSQLEESLLLDLTSALVEVFSGLFKGFDFHPPGSVVRGQWPFEAQGTEEFCKISFYVKKAGSDKGYETYLLIPCSKLESEVGKTEESADKLSANDISKLIHEHLRAMPVLVTAQLACPVLTFEEILNLQVDDVLLLDKRVNQPVELIVDGQTVSYGWPAKSAGKYAVKITATAFGGTASEINPGTGA